MKRQSRIDIDLPWGGQIELRPSAETPEGFLLGEGVLARTGIYEYQRRDGKTRRELVDKETLADPESLATLEEKPLAVDHPLEGLDPTNVDEHGVGSMSQVEFHEVDQYNGLVKVRLAIRRKDGIKAVRVDGYRELSPGYTITPESGGTHPEFGEYDVRQTERVYNHGALVQQARGGSSMRARFDAASGTNQAPADAVMVGRADQSSMKENVNDTQTKGAKLMAQINLDGMSLEVDDPQTARVINEWRRDQQEEREDLSSELEQARALIKEYEEQLSEKKEELNEKMEEFEQMKGELDTLRNEMMGPDGPSDEGPGETEAGPAGEDDQRPEGASPSSPTPSGEDSEDGGSGMTPNEDGRGDSANLNELADERIDLLMLAKQERVDADNPRELSNDQLRRKVVEARLDVDDASSWSSERLKSSVDTIRRMEGQRKDSLDQAADILQPKTGDGDGGDDRTDGGGEEQAQQSYRETLAG